MLLNNKNKARTISFCGIFLALNLIILIATNFIPTNKISLILIASLFPAFILIEFGYKTATIYNLSQVILAFFLMNNKILFFGFLLSIAFYGLFKSIIETKFKNILIEFTIKISYYISSFMLIYFFINPFPMYKNYIIILFILYIVIFLAYDFIYTLFIAYYIKDIQKKIKNIIKNK